MMLSVYPARERRICRDSKTSSRIKFRDSLPEAPSTTALSRFQP
jgi:hypothetical protein